MLKDLTPAQRELAECMSDISEEAYCAGWMMGLEYCLWEALLGLRHNYGRMELPEEQKARLRQLSGACGGWILFDDVTEETWVPTADWEGRFAAWRGAGGHE